MIFFIGSDYKPVTPILLQISLSYAIFHYRPYAYHADLGKYYNNSDRIYIPNWNLHYYTIFFHKL